MMTTKPLGLYVHIPFCVRKCNYCDFCSFPEGKVDWRDKYIDALCSEIELYKGRNITLNSIFFGGGTPSLLSIDEFSRVFETVKQCFSLDSDIEFTVEANPKTLDREKLRSFVSFGVNRLSIGLQSIHENEMKMLGRIHNYADFKECYAMARECGIKNINVDLMYGIPEQTMDSFSKTLDDIIALRPEHLSLYGLILEEGTRFFEKKDSLALPTDDAECDMYYLACRRLADAGYSHYEISNYALDGHKCRHNLKYWRDEEYIGVGLSAYSYFDGRRFGNSRDVSEYLSSNYAKYDSGEIISCTDEAYEYVMLGLRLSEGFSLSEYKDRFGADFIVGREKFIESLVKEGYMKIADGRIFLTERGFYVSNMILSELI
ncbi:MAG: radical SAM family heme chaperone HemW [Clostridia bacterium]|nr:radical SAM family heme chaperone HemW [Clostridia bacterium]